MDQDFNQNKKFDYEQIRLHKMSTAPKKKMIHVPRYLVVVIWGLFMTFVVYTYALITINELDQQSVAFDQKPMTKVKATIEFLPNEPEPQFAPLPAF